MWLLYNTMEAEHKTTYVASCTLHTYTFILQEWLLYGPESENWLTLSGAIIQDPIALLRNIVRQESVPALATSNRAFTSSEEATKVICLLSKVALHLA